MRPTLIAFACIGAAAISVAVPDPSRLRPVCQRL